MPTPEQIIELLRKHPGELWSSRAIMDELAIPVGEKREVRNILRELARGGEITRFRGGAFAIQQGRQIIEGVLQTTRHGDGFIIAQGEMQEDVFVPRRGMGAALNGDWVEANLAGHSHGQLEARILRVVRHAHERIVGQFMHTEDGGLVLPKDAKIGRRVRILRRHSKSAIPEGAWVVTKITHWSDSSVEPLIGQVEEVLGVEGDRGIDVLVLLRDMGVETEFAPEVVEEAEALRGPHVDNEAPRRRDLRGIVTFTIDPETAKDFDDALSIEPLENGAVRLGVHIADVSHYVRTGTQLDAAAYERATSIYPVDRVVPMLPQALSNDLCSLRPNEDRLTMSVFADLSRSGEILRAEIVESIIHSRFRLSYEEVQAVFDEQPFPRAAELKIIETELHDLRDLTRLLTRQRMKRGALDLDLPETDIIMGLDGEVADVRPHPRFESHRLVEECMLLANEIVARHLTRKKLPGLYRVHEEPDPSSLEKLRAIMYPFGVRFSRGNIDMAGLQGALDHVRQLEGGHILMRFVLRALKKARYDPRNLGHYGLASTHYCHFTSPIRRYPDLIVHRVIKESLGAGGLTPERREELEDNLSEMAAHTSEREENAERIERNATTIKSLEFIKPRLGEVFEGKISGLAKFGMFIELAPWPIEGLIPIRTLDDDYYEFDDMSFTLRGRRSGKTYHLADKVRVMIERVDPPGQQMDLQLIQQTAKKTKSKPSYTKRKVGTRKRR